MRKPIASLFTVAGLFTAVIIAVLTFSALAADGDREWPAYGSDKGGSKYSPLDQINKNTVKNLRIAWRVSGMPDELRPTYPDVQASANFQNTPLMVGGMLYMSSAVGCLLYTSDAADE